MFSLLLLLIIYVGWTSERKRKKRATAAQEAEGMHGHEDSAAGAAKAEKKRRLAEKRELDRRIEAAAAARREEMKWFDVGMRVDDRWRERMDAKMYGRPVEHGFEEMEVDRSQAEMAYQMPVPQQQQQQQPEQETETALIVVLEWLLQTLVVTGHYFEVVMKKVVKTCAAVGGLWFLYRLLAYFTKEDYARRGNEVDIFLTAMLQAITTIFLALILPIFVIGGGYFIRHDNRIQVCHLCGREGPIDQQHVNHTRGIDLCLKCRWENEYRIAEEEALKTAKIERAREMGTTYEALEAEVAKRKQREAAEAEHLRTASRPPSGQRFSPAPYPPKPRRPTVLDLLCNSEAGAREYSDYRRHTPGDRKYSQKPYNPFEAKPAFMTPIAEEDGDDGDLRMGMGTRSTRRAAKGSRSSKEMYMADLEARHRARLPAEVQRVLWPTMPNPNKWKQTPYKRYS